ncbi:MAG TPA: hypothetical protein PLV55_05945 [Anaerohalosphaeraceae bacterium]|nr:hypothetical protein [Anaerohalosphaeraceae bacterium]
MNPAKINELNKLIESTLSFYGKDETGEILLRLCKKNHISLPSFTPPDGLQQSEFGCRNCLWAAAECIEHSLYIPADDRQGHKTCGNYVYYD